jgi:hypothetical protein
MSGLDASYRGPPRSRNVDISAEELFTDKATYRNKFKIISILGSKSVFGTQLGESYFFKSSDDRIFYEIIKTKTGYTINYQGGKKENIGKSQRIYLEPINEALADEVREDREVRPLKSPSSVADAPLEPEEQLGRIDSSPYDDDIRLIDNGIQERAYTNGVNDAKNGTPKRTNLPRYEQKSYDAGYKSITGGRRRRRRKKTQKRSKKGNV